MEYFGELTETGPVNAPNLKEKLKQQCSSQEFQQILLDVLNAVITLHGYNILHNDLKADNFIFARDSVKLIDFGKATLIAFPKTYNILPGSVLALKYNKCHRHLAHELRNIPGSIQSELTDTYSIEFMFKHMAAQIGCQEIVFLGKNMKVKEPEFRV